MTPIMDALNARLQRNANHNYLVISNAGEEEPGDYQLRMMMENHIPYLLPVESRLCEGHYNLYYEISSLQSVERIFECKEIEWNELHMLIDSILAAYHSVQDYLLDESHLILNPELIFTDLETEQMKLLFVPSFEVAFEDSFRELAEYLLEHICHKDTLAVSFGYQFYKLIRKENFVLGDIKELLEAVSEEAMNWGHEDSDLDQDDMSQHLSEVNMVHESIPDSQELLGRNSDQVSQKIVFNKRELIKQTTHKETLTVPTKYQEQTQGYSRQTLLIRLLLCLTFCVACLSLLFDLLPGIGVKGTGKVVTAGLMAVNIGVLLRWIYMTKWQKKELQNDSSDSIALQVNAPVSTPIPLPETVEQPIPNYGKTTILLEDNDTIKNVLVEKNKGIEHPMEHFPYLIGKLKENVQLVLKDSAVSRIHARIIKEQEHYYLEDCNSSNGTFLNGILLEPGERVLLHPEDEIKVGHVILQYY